uniref:Uncharacterized protein n=1 Tax=Myoviridae sp. ctJ2i1 TaxID=2825079 RepID=A0A8S5V1Q0_9CAUD|nr:MAG TPA: hypothetical protein [Myoviridae sp. ctJ2i1]
MKNSGLNFFSATFIPEVISEVATCNTASFLVL